VVTNTPIANKEVKIYGPGFGGKLRNNARVIQEGKTGAGYSLTMSREGNKNHSQKRTKRRGTLAEKKNLPLG